MGKCQPGVFLLKYVVIKYTFLLDISTNFY